MRDRMRTFALSYPHVAILSGIFWGIIYLSTLTHVHTFDALSYIFDVSRKPWQESFHPHHLAYGPVGVLATWLARGGDAAVVMQQINALAGATGVALFVAIVTRRWQRSDLGILASLALGGSYAFWYYAVEVEVYTLAALFLLWMIYLVDTPAPLTYARAVWLGVAWCGAVLFHQTNVLMLVALTVAAVTAIRTSHHAWRPWLVMTTVAGGLVIAAYTLVMVGVSGFRDLNQAQAWLFHYAETGWWGGRGTIADLGTGISLTVAAHNGGWVLLAGLVCAIGHLRQARWSYNALWLGAWVLCYGVFFFWWEPDNIEFWISITPVVILLWLHVWATAPRWHWSLWLVIGLAAGSATSNLVAIQLRGDARLDLQRDIARTVAAQSQPADLLLIPDGLQELYLPYYEQRTYFWSVNALMTQYGTWPAACAALQDAMADTQRAGAAIIVAADFLTPSRVMQQRFGLAPDVVRTCLAAQLPLLTPLAIAPPIPAHDQIPRPGALLMQGAWQQILVAPLGWQLTNAQVIPGNTWSIRVDTDPALVSPILDIPMPTTLIIRMQADGTRDQNAQLFVSDQVNQFAEAQSVRWQLMPGMHEYTIDLSQLAVSPTRLVQLRIDPVADGGEGTITIAGIWMP